MAMLQANQQMVGVMQQSMKTNDTKARGSKALDTKSSREVLQTLLYLCKECRTG